jgi:uncharacterized protein (TIRG00374 family)
MRKIRKFEREIIFAFVLGLVISSLLAFWGDFKQTVNQILSFNWWLAPIVLALTCFNYSLRFLRWHLFLKKVGLRHKLGIKKSALVFLSGLPLTLTPGKTGEVLKAYFLKRVVGDHLSRTIPVVVIERLTDGLGALLLLSFGFYSYRFGWLAFLFALFSCSLFIFLIYHDQFWKLLAKLLERRGRDRPLLEGMEQKLTDFRKVILELIGWKNLAAATLLAAIAWFAEAIGFALIITSIANYTMSLAVLSQAVFIFCLVSILGFVSFLPGGLGVAEGGFVGILILNLGLSRSQAVASTILLRLLTLWWGVGIGLIAFFLVLRKFSGDD